MYFTYITRLLYFYYIIYGMIFTINTIKTAIIRYICQYVGKYP